MVAEHGIAEASGGSFHAVARSSSKAQCEHPKELERRRSGRGRIHGFAIFVPLHSFYYFLGGRLLAALRPHSPAESPHPNTFSTSFPRSFDAISLSDSSHSSSSPSPLVAPFAIEALKLRLFLSIVTSFFIYNDGLVPVPTTSMETFSYFSVLHFEY